MNKRTSRLRAALAREKLGALLVSGPANIRYLCGYTGSNGLMLVTKKKSIFYTDFRYQEQIRTEVTGCRKRVLKRDLYSAFPLEDARGVRHLGVESGQLTLARYRLLKRGLKGIKLVPSHDIVMELRRTKEPDEVERIAAAQALTDAAFARVLKLVKPGVTENDLALEIDFHFRRAGGEHAFESIVASGPNAAKPHAGHSARKLKSGDAVTFDIGCRLDGYCSDMTRTVFVGRAASEMHRVYEIVLQAQSRALDMMKAGVLARDADAAARGYIADAGYGKYFGHGLGHGVGMEVHERPGLAAPSKDVLAPGDIVTVEPGIYLPGVGGVRIEDMVLVTRTGLRNLTHSPKHIIEL